MRHFRRLGFWKPEPGSDFDDLLYGDYGERNVSRAFAEWLGIDSKSIDIDTRGPKFHQNLRQLVYGVCNQSIQGKFDYPFDYPTTYWHRDGVEDGQDDGWEELVMWSNRRPTEICLPNGRIVKGRSCEAIAFRNTTCLHRTPFLRKQDRDRRNFIRVVMPEGWTFLG